MAIAKTSDEIQIVEIQTATITVAIRGVTPLICNRMTAKVYQELLLPKMPKTAADKASTLKHDPVAEFRDSFERFVEPTAPTLFAIPAVALKSAMRTAALDLPGMKKAQIGRLTYVEGQYLGVYGVPKIFSTITRNSDVSRTPDVRTRAIIEKWAMVASITFTRPILREQGIANLIAAAGITAGVGDFRQEKGSGNFGKFTVVGMDDPELREIMSTGGRQAQIAAVENPQPYDENTDELLSWFGAEVRRRGFKVA